MTPNIDFQAALLTRKQFLLSELQTHGLRPGDPNVGAVSRVGGAGPTDHKAVTVLGTTIMAPVHTSVAARSPYLATPPDQRCRSLLQQDGRVLCEISFPPQPGFYALSTADGIAYWKIAQLHSRDTLATTVLQTCIRWHAPVCPSRLSASRRPISLGFNACALLVWTHSACTSKRGMRACAAASCQAKPKCLSPVTWTLSPPPADFMRSVLQPLGKWLTDAG